MKGFKKIIASVLLVLTLCCAAVPGEARAEEYMTKEEALEYFGITFHSNYAPDSDIWNERFDDDYPYFMIYHEVERDVYYFATMKTPITSFFVKSASSGSYATILVQGYGSGYMVYNLDGGKVFSGSSSFSSPLYLQGFDLLYANFDGFTYSVADDLSYSYTYDFTPDYISTVPQVTVPSLSGMTQSEADAALSAAGLVLGTVTEEDSTAVPAGQVISQSVAADTSVDEGTVVDIVISSGLPKVIVPDLSGMTQAEVNTALAELQLVLGSVTEEDSTTVPSGEVISQSIAAGESVTVNSAVDIVISSGLPDVTVPDLSGMTQSEADAALSAAGLVLGSVTEEDSTTVASGEVISQSVAADSSILYGSVVDIVISSGLPQVTVPSLINMTRSQADTQLLSNGLVLGTVTEEDSTTVPSGQIISQSVAAGSSVLYGTAVDVVISSGVPAVDVPDVSGMSQSDAVAALTGAGFTVTVSREYSDSVPSGQVISQSVASGSTAAAGSTVDIVLSRGPAPTPIPVGTGDIVDMTITILDLFRFFPLNVFLMAALLLLGVGLYRDLKSST